MQHQSRFKPFLISHVLLEGEAQSLRPSLTEIQNLLQAQKIQLAEAVFLFLVTYLEKRAPSAWWCKKKSAPLVGSEFRVHSLSSNFAVLKSFPVNTVNEWLTLYDFKKLPGSVLNAVRGWLGGSHHLQLVEAPITPYQMLKLQAKGMRVVTLALAQALSGQTVDGRRDAFEFVLHDLLHADLMFATPAAREAQQQFFSSLQVIHDQKLIEPELENDSDFKTSFEYLISDMNSHSHHMAHLLKASYINFLLKKDKAAQLSASSQVDLANKMQELQTAGNFSPKLTDI